MTLTPKDIAKKIRKLEAEIMVIEKAIDGMEKARINNIAKLAELKLEAK